MAISKSVTGLIAVIIIAVLIGVILVELQIFSKPTSQLVISDSKIRLVDYGSSNHILIVDGNITNIGKTNVTNIVLFIQTYYQNGTESFNWNMTLWQNVTRPNTYLEEIHPTNVTIDAGQSYLVQSGNWEFTNSIEHPILPYGYPSPYGQLYDDYTQGINFFASYKITPYYQTV